METIVERVIGWGKKTIVPNEDVRNLLKLYSTIMIGHFDRVWRYSIDVYLSRNYYQGRDGQKALTSIGKMKDSPTRPTPPPRSAPHRDATIGPINLRGSVW
jgi:hypothetical protein